MGFEIGRDGEILDRTPSVLAAMLKGLPREWTHSNYGPNTWSPHEIVGHLIFGDRTDWMARARMIIDRGESATFEPFDRAGHGPLCAAHSTDELLEIFARERAATLLALHALDLTPALLSRKARHPALGPATLSELLSTWVVHDLNHIAQIAKAMAYQRKADVGPWEAYLSILAPPAPR